jgi:thiamine pyrophosphate-dependent acetolactate synthase large subunit-like protein
MGVAQAFGESVPLLVIPQGYPRRIAHVPPNFNSTLAMAHVAKHFRADHQRQGSGQHHAPRLQPAAQRPRLAGDHRAAARRLCRGCARSAGTTSPSSSPSTVPIRTQVAEAAKVLMAAKRPVIYAGQGVHWAEAYAELQGAGRALAIPVCTSLEGKSCFDETHPLSLGSGGRAYPKAVRSFLDRSDVILGIGCSFTETNFGISMPSGKTIIHATLDPAHLNKDVRIKYGLVGDAKLTLRALLDACKGWRPRDSTAVAAEIKQISDEWLKEWMPKLTNNDAPLNPYRVLWDLQNTVDVANTIITHDAGSPRDQLSPFWKTTQPHTYIGWGKTTQLGYGLGLAMGAKLACPDKLCINVWGDAAIGFTGMDFETAVRERIPILSILLNNFSMAIELHIMKVSTEKYRSTDISGDYAADGARLRRLRRARDQARGHHRRRSSAASSRPGRAVPVLLEFITSKEVTISVPK